MHTKLDDIDYVTSLFFKSTDKLISDPINDFTINTNSGIKGIDYIAINHAQIFNNLYQFNLYNGVFSFKYGPGAGLVSYSVNLVNNSYLSGTDLSTQLQTLIRAITLDVGITVTYSNITNKLIFTATGLNFFQIVLGGASYNIGFGQQNETGLYPALISLTNPLNSQYPISLKYTSYVDIESRFFGQYQLSPTSGSLGSKTSSNLLIRLRLESQHVNSVRDYPVRHLLLIPWKYDEVISGAIDLALKDDQGRYLDAQNSEYNIEVACFRKKNYIFQ